MPGLTEMNPVLIRLEIVRGHLILGESEEALSNLERAIADGLDPAEGNGYMERLVELSRELAVAGVGIATTWGGDPAGIEDALEELDAVTAPGGALEALIELREQGLTRYLGITGHGPDAPRVHLEALERFDFDTVMFPLTAAMYRNPDYRRDAEALRTSGELLALGKRIDCPVVAIHGDYDPHPADGIRKPLSSVLEDFRFILLDNCGHYPWNERQARDAFYEVLRDELSTQ